MAVNAKLIRRYNYIGEEMEAVQRLVSKRADSEVIRARLARLEAKQADLQEMLLQLIDLSKPADKAWRSHWFEVDS